MTRKPPVRRLLTTGAAALLALAGIASLDAQTGEETDNEAYLIAKGRVTYKVYCANCHGEKGVGDGPLAEILKVPPADLTRIAERNNGVFPRGLIADVIDGRKQMKSHGTREMPIWGEAFQLTLRPTWKEVSDEERAQIKILEVSRFVESIQEPTD